MYFIVTTITSDDAAAAFPVISAQVSADIKQNNEFLVSLDSTVTRMYVIGALSGTPQKFQRRAKIISGKFSFPKGQNLEEMLLTGGNSRIPPVMMGNDSPGSICQRL